MTKRRALLAVLTAGLLSTALTTPAQAAAFDNGTYPNATRPGGGAACNQNSAWIASRPVQNELGQTVTTVDVYYSYSCATNWIRVQSNPGGGLAAKSIWVDGGTVFNEPDYGYGSSFTKQVYAPGATCVNFQVHLYDTAGRSVGETYTAGANHQRIC